MIHLTRLKVIRFRDVKPDTELHFSKGWNVVLGRNATGKTTLLHLISMALRGDFSELRDEAFELEYDIEGEAWSATVALTHDFANVRQTAGVQAFDPAEYRVPATYCAVHVTVERTVYVVSAYPVADPGQVPIVVPALPERMSLLVGALVFTAHARGASALHDIAEEMTSRAASYRFDEALGLFRIILHEPDDNVGGPRESLALAIGMYGQEHLVLSLIPVSQ